MESTQLNNWRENDNIFDTIFKQNEKFDGSNEENSSKSEPNQTISVCDSFTQKSVNCTSGDLNSRENGVKNNKVNMKSIWKNFASSTSLHGLVYIQENNITVIGRIIWCALFVGMFGCLGYVLIDLLLTYWEYPFTSVWSLRRETMIDTPTITMCPFNFYNFTKIKESSVKNFFDHKTWFNLTPEEKDSPPYNETLTTLLDTYGFSKESMIVYAALILGRQEKIEDTDMITKRYIHNQICFTINDFRDEFQFEERLRNEHVLDIEVELQRKDGNKASTDHGIALYLHKKGSTMINQSPLLIPPGYSTYVLFKQTDYTFLPLPYDSFSKSGCLDLDDPDFVNPLLKFPLYTRDNCMIENVEKMVAEKCGCCAREYTDIFNVTECTAIEWVFCYWDSSYSLEQGHHENICPFPCNDTVIDIASSSSILYEPDIGPNSSRFGAQEFVHIVLQPKTTNIEMVKHVPELTLVKILATVGGYLGLFLGASLLTAAECAQVIMASFKFILLKFGKKEGSRCDE